MQMSWQHRATEQSIGSFYPELHQVKERTLLLMLRRACSAVDASWWSTSKPVGAGIAFRTLAEAK